MRIRAVCHSVMIRRRISRSSASSLASVRAVRGALITSCRARIDAPMCFCTSKTVRRRVSVGCAVSTGTTSADSIIDPISAPGTRASRSFAHVASSEESRGASPASRPSSTNRSSWRSSARFASSAKWVNARMIGVASTGSMSRNSAVSSPTSASPRWRRNAVRRAFSTRLKTSSPSCSRITSPRIRPRCRMSSRNVSSLVFLVACSCMFASPVRDVGVRREAGPEEAGAPDQRVNVAGAPGRARSSGLGCWPGYVTWKSSLVT